MRSSLATTRRPGCVAIEAVDDPGPFFAGERGKPIEMKLEGVDQRATPVSSAQGV